MTDVKDTVAERSAEYCSNGTYHTLANLSQTLTAIAKQHYVSVRTKEGQPPAQPMPNFMAESLQMINHKIARIINGNENHIDSWQDIAGYAQLVVNILEEQENLYKAKLKEQLEAKMAEQQDLPLVEAEALN